MSVKLDTVEYGLAVLIPGHLDRAGEQSCLHVLVNILFL